MIANFEIARARSLRYRSAVTRASELLLVFVLACADRVATPPTVVSRAAASSPPLGPGPPRAPPLALRVPPRPPGPGRAPAPPRLQPASPLPCVRLQRAGRTRRCRH